MFNTELNHQRFFSGHDDDVMTLCRHPSSDILASGQAGPRPSRVCVYDASGKDVEPISTFLPSTTAKGRRLSLWEHEHQLLDCKLKLGYSKSLLTGICGVDFSPDGELLVVVVDEDSYYKVSVWDWRKACLLTQMLCKASLICRLEGHTVGSVIYADRDLSPFIHFKPESSTT
jgi:WD40 repeat protein